MKAPGNLYTGATTPTTMPRNNHLQTENSHQMPPVERHMAQSSPCPPIGKSDYNASSEAFFL